jgi:4-amino-4-deoxy-L-arabinose transferase-like glycosyltransferase
MEDRLFRKYWGMALLFAAFGVRAGYNLWGVGVNDLPSDDALDYHEIAVALLDTGDYRHLGRPPLFPVALAGVYGLFGVHPFYGRVFLSVMGALTCGVIYLMGREAFGARVGAYAAWGAAFYAMLFRWSGYLLTETLFTFLLCLFIWSSQKSVRSPRLHYALAAGLFLGLATLTRPTTLAFIPFILLWAVLTFSPGWKRALTVSGAIAVTLVLTLAPWTVRNYRATGHIVPVTVMGGQVLIGANNPNVLDRFPGGWIPPLQSGLVTEEDIRGLSPVERDDLYQRRAMAFIRNNPLYFARLCVYKVKLFWHLHRATDPASLQYLFVAGCALVGMIRNLKQWRQQAIFYLMLFFFTLSALIFWGDDRLRSPVEPVLLVFAATTWCRGADILARR